VNAEDDFAQPHKIIDAASDLIIARLGDKGRHARTAIGCSTLPNNNAVTLDAIARLAS
jgi:enamine deaminase RidA (YjgF/YER057c/UK114 family)